MGTEDLGGSFGLLELAGLLSSRGLVGSVGLFESLGFVGSTELELRVISWRTICMIPLQLFTR